MNYKQIEYGNSIIISTDQFDFFEATLDRKDDVIKDIESLEHKEVAKQVMKSGSDKKLKKLIILMSTDCNLRCRYCYLNYGKYKQDNTHNIEVGKAKKAIELILESFPEGIGFIQFFGGEPLLAFKQVVEIHDYVTDRFTELKIDKPSFGLVTNGLLIDKEKIEFFNKNKIKITISIDGDEQIHNLVRIKPNSTGAFDNVSKMMEQYHDEFTTSYFYEMTLNREHINNYKPGKMKEWLDAIRRLGFTIGITGVVEYSHDSTLDFTKDDIPTLKLLYSELVDYFFNELEKDNSSFYNLDICKIFLFILKKDFREYCCNTGVKQLTLSADGEFYPCPKFAAINKKNGSVDEGSIDLTIGDEVIKKDNREQCVTCWLRYACKSYCYALKYRNIDGREVIPIRCIHNDLMFENIIRNIISLKKRGKLVEVYKKVCTILKNI